MSQFKEKKISTIPENWKLCPLSDVAEFIRGFSYRGSEKNKTHGDFSFITLNSVLEGGGFKKVFSFITSDRLKEKNFVVKGDIVIANTEQTKTGTLLGCPALVDFPPNYNKNKSVFSHHITKVNIISNTSTKFLYYCLLYIQPKAVQYHTGSVIWALDVKNWSKNELIILPPIEEQKLIEKILSDLDSKIELNQQMNKTLEELGQAIFKHWFIDFEFPNEQGKPYKSSGGEMVYNEELGKEIPSNSRVINLGELIELDKGLSYKGAFLTNNEDGLPMVNLGTFRPLGGFNDDQMKYYSGEFKERHLVKSGDLVIANTDITQNRVILGSPSLIPSYLNSEKILFTHHVYAVRNKNNLIKNEFLYYVLQSSEYRNRVKGFATGTTVLALPRDAILELPIILFDESILNNFDKLIKNIIKKIETNYLQILNLSKTRDSLLPKLMSGKIRVPLEAN